MDAIIIDHTEIGQDEEGRYCLNDLHKAAVLAGANKRTKEPGKFIASTQIVDLVREIETTQILGGSAVHTIQGSSGGTYVVKELVYAYAMWVSPSFHLKVIRAYDAMVTAQLERLSGLRQRALRAELDYLEGMEHASRCGLGLRRWRDEAPDLKSKLELLKLEMQPLLPMFH